MSVHQTREHFLQKYGRIVDNERVGNDLTESYWLPGNGKPFLSLVQNLTGKPLSGDAWVKDLSTPVATVLKEEEAAYKKAVSEGPKYKHGVDVSTKLDMRIRLVHGDDLIADSEKDGGLVSACAIYKQWLTTL